MSGASLEDRVAAIEARNAKVQIDKAWETSFWRRSLISIITYVVAGLLLGLMGSDNPWFSAFIPVVGYLLSTLTLPFVRQQWEKTIHANNK